VNVPQDRIFGGYRAHMLDLTSGRPKAFQVFSNRA
jgi:hypothetical protein